MEGLTTIHDSSESFFEGPNINPFGKRFIEIESPKAEANLDSDAIFRLETDEEQFRRHMECFRKIKGMGKLPDDDGEEGETPPWGYIHFDERGRLWYRQYSRKKWERAVFHYWIRHELGVQFKQIPYDFPRERGLLLGDETCSCAHQRTWGIEREDYPYVMFQYSPPSVRPPLARVGHLTFGGLVVIDFGLAKISKFDDIPWVLSSKYEGAFMEPSRRYNSAICYGDFRARMPPIIREGKVLKPLYSVTDLFHRTSRFRDKAGCIAWDPAEDGGTRTNYMDARLTRLLGDARHPDFIKGVVPNLSALEIFDLRVFGSEMAPNMATAAVILASKKHHPENIERQAGLAIDTPMMDATDDSNERSIDPGPSAFPFCPSGESRNSRSGIPDTAEERLASFAWLDSFAKRNGQLMDYEPTDFSDSHKCWYSRWVMIQRELYAHWRPDTVFYLSRHISDLKKMGIGPLDSKRQALHELAKHERDSMDSSS